MANEVRINVTSRDRTGPGFKSARNNADQLGSSTKRIGEIAAGVLASGVFQRIADSAVRAFTSTIAAASSLEQAVGGTEAVFGDASGAIDDFAQHSADSVGLSERAFREATTLIGGQLKRMTGDIGFASDASIQLVEVGADLAATYGGTTKEAVDAFAAALRGEADPAERFNLNLKVSEVNAKAVELGLAATTSEVDENARAQALLALVMEQSADAQGQFARESDTHAGAQQRFAASVEDAQAAFGEKLLPVLAAGTELATAALAGFQQLPGPMQAIVGILAAAAALTPGIIALKTALAALSISIRGVMLALGPAGAAIAALGTVLTIMGKNSQEAEEQQRNLADIMRQVAAAAEEERRQVAATALQQDDIKETADELGISLATLTDIVLGDSDAMERLRTRLQGVVEENTVMVDGVNKSTETITGEGKAAQELIGWLEDVESTSKSVAEEQQELGEATEGAGEAHRVAAGLVSDYQAAVEDANAELEEAETAYDEAKAALEEYSAEQRKAVDPVFALIDATNDVTEKQKAYNEAVEEHGKKSPEATQASLDLADAVANAEEAARDGDLSFDDFKTKLDRWVESGAITEEQAKNIRDSVDEAKDAADKYEDEYTAELKLKRDRAKERAAQREMDKIAATRRARMVAEITGGQSANRDLNDIARDRFADVFVDVHYPPGGGRIPDGVYASGGVVGEGRKMPHGGVSGAETSITVNDGVQPEAIRTPRGSLVIPSLDQAFDRNQVGGAPSVVFQMVNHGVIGSQHDLEQWLLAALDDLQRQGRLSGVA